MGAAACAGREFSVGEKVEGEARGSLGKGKGKGQGVAGSGGSGCRGPGGGGIGSRRGQAVGAAGGPWPLARALLRGAQQARLAPEAAGDWPEHRAGFCAYIYTNTYFYLCVKDLVEQSLCVQTWPSCFGCSLCPGVLDGE